MNRSIKIAEQDYRIIKAIAKEQRRSIKTIISMAVNQFGFTRKETSKK